MDIDSEYLSFMEDDHYEGKTKRIVVLSKRHGTILGEIKWFGAWRQYTFWPDRQTVWNTQCLEDVQSCICALMDERKKK